MVSHQIGTIYSSKYLVSCPAFISLPRHPLRLRQRHADEFLDQLARARIVQANQPFEAGGSDLFAVRAVGECVDRASLAFEFTYQLPIAAPVGQEEHWRKRAAWRQAH